MTTAVNTIVSLQDRLRECLRRWFNCEISDADVSSLLGEAIARIDALESSLTARDELLRNVHLSEGDGTWLYSTWGERDWIKQRDAILANGQVDERAAKDCLRELHEQR